MAAFTSIALGVGVATSLAGTAMSLSSLTLIAFHSLK